MRVLIALEDLVAGLEGQSGITPIDPDAALYELGVDSFDLSVWVSDLERDLGVVVDDETLAAMRDQSLRQIHARLFVLEAPSDR